MEKLKALAHIIFAPENIAIVIHKSVSIFIIVLLIYTAYKIVESTMTAALKRNSKGKHMEMLTTLLKSTLLYVMAFFMLVSVLQELGINLTAILASAGVVGLAVSFGAQTLVKDIIAGVYIIMENQMNIGEEVQIFNNIGKPDCKGRVIEMNLRTTVLRENDGILCNIPNGSIGYITNFSRK